MSTTGSLLLRRSPMWTPQRVPVIPVLVFALLLLLPPISQAATPSSGTMSTGTPTLTWGGGPFTADPAVVYRVAVLVYRAVNESYTAKADLVTVPAEPPNQFRTASYTRFDFGFRPELKLPDQERSLVFIDQDVEPEIEVDRFGTIYIGAIRGIPGGVDFWRSDDGGASFRFLGQPDGTQNPTPTPNPPPEGGGGGGDDDIALGDPFFVVPP